MLLMRGSLYLTCYLLPLPQLLHWEATPGGGVEVTTDKGHYKAEKLVLSSGAWLHKHVPELEVGTSNGWQHPADTVSCRLKAAKTNPYRGSRGSVTRGKGMISCA